MQTLQLTTPKLKYVRGPVHDDQFLLLLMTASYSAQAVERQRSARFALWVAVIAPHDFADGIFVSLLRGLAGPVSILRVVVLDAEAHIVEVSKLELSPGAALLRGAAIPLRGLGIVARYALAKLVKVGEPLLRLCKSLRCCEPIPVGRKDVIFCKPLLCGRRHRRRGRRSLEARLGCWC